MQIDFKRMFAGLLCIVFGAVQATPVLAATQNGYRWRADDGSETAATWSAAENTPATSVAKNSTHRLRFG